MEKYKEEVFVFVVCGGREHIDTLHFSLKALQKFSAKRIIVVTDSTRNEVSVIHSEIIDIKTPENFDHHQASIYLKTGLHKFLPKGNLYCYLDTDVVALSTDVDTIFEQYQSPIIFCTDLGNMATFSPYSVNCQCLDFFLKKVFKLSHTIQTFQEEYYIADLDCSLRLNNSLVLAKNYSKETPAILNYIDDCILDISKSENKLKKNSVLYFLHKIKYTFPFTYYQLSSKFKMDKKSGRWYDRNNLFLRYEKLNIFQFVNEQTGFIWDESKQEWLSEFGESITNLACNHLLEAIHSKFKIEVKNQNWQHWNGGVFLFDDTSTDFLEQWHMNTLTIFNDENWKTRDQGTLIATVWKFNLQNHPTLSLVYNLIADYHNKSIQYKNNLSFCVGNDKKFIIPHFIHVYHHWGDKEWAVWNDVEKHILG